MKWVERAILVVMALVVETMLLSVAYRAGFLAGLRWAIDYLKHGG